MKSKNTLRSHPKIKPNQRIKMEGYAFLSELPDHFATICFFDPQYRGVLDKMKYGNEGKKRGKARSSLKQMSEDKIRKFLIHINRVLKPSGHLFLWIDKFHLCEGTKPWFKGTDLETVDMITWDKTRLGMGYRTRRQCEYLLVLQKKPKKAKGVWKSRKIPDVWPEKISNKNHTHEKPLELQKALIKSVSKAGDIVVDPASGSFSVLKCCKDTKRKFYGCDIKG